MCQEVTLSCRGHPHCSPSALGVLNYSQVPGGLMPSLSHMPFKCTGPLPETITGQQSPLSLAFMAHLKHHLCGKHPLAHVNHKARWSASPTGPTRSTCACYSNSPSCTQGAIYFLGHLCRTSQFHTTAFYSFIDLNGGKSTLKL